MNFELQDSNENKIVIHLGDFPLPELSKNPMNIDCVAISPRYDHGFGFSQLYRVVKDKNSDEIKNLCDLSKLTNQIQLLPKHFSDVWRVILTPTVKFNNETARPISKNLMLKLFSLSQTDEIGSKTLLITHFGNLQSYPDKSIDGVIDGLAEIKNQSFLKLKEIYIEIEGKFQYRFEEHFISRLQKK